MQLKSAIQLSAHIIDNGAYTIKTGNSSVESPKIIPNCIMKVKSERRRPFIGDEIEECRDVSGLFYLLAFQRGYLINWDIQKSVWDYVFNKDAASDFRDAPVVITEPMFNFSSIQEAMNEIFFEEYECTSLLRINATDLSAFKYNKDNNTGTLLVVDTGYSFTHIVPYIDSKKYRMGIRRIDVGGKVLTNHLKEIISYRQLHVMDETYVINQVKEDVCFVSQDYLKDLQKASKRGAENDIILDYVLPDYSKIKRGYVYQQNAEQDENLRNLQTIKLNNERVAIPEILFNPSDIGISQMGIAEAIVECVNSCPIEHQNQLVSNIVVTGGNAMFPGFKERLLNDVRALCPEEWTVNVFVPANPITYAWSGGKELSKSEDFRKMCVTKEEYEAGGHRITFERFDI